MHLATVYDWILFGIGAFIVFFSYQAIPQNLERLQHSNKGRLGAVVTSKVFTVFVRWCGIHHIIMYTGMVVIALIQHANPEMALLVFRIIIASEWMVALVSAISAIAIYDARKGV